MEWSYFAFVDGSRLSPSTLKYAAGAGSKAFSVNEGMMDHLCGVAASVVQCLPDSRPFAA